MEVSECPQCGAPANASERRCGYCKAEFFVTSIAYLGNLDSTAVGKYLKHFRELTHNAPADAEGLLGLGLCYLQMGTNPLAKKAFEKVIDIAPEIAQAYYYHALSSVGGRRLISMPLKDVRVLETYLNTAVQLNGELPQCKLFLAMLKRDYYEMNGMRVQPPSADELLDELAGCKIEAEEFVRLKDSVRIGDETLFDSIELS